MSDRDDRIEGARAFLDLLEGTPDTPLPYELDRAVAFTIFVRGDTAREQIAAAMMLPNATAHVAVSTGIQADAVEVHVPFGPLTVAWRATLTDVAEYKVVGTQPLKQWMFQDIPLTAGPIT